MFVTGTVEKYSLGTVPASMPVYWMPVEGRSLSLSKSSVWKTRTQRWPLSGFQASDLCYIVLNCYLLLT